MSAAELLRVLADGLVAAGDRDPNKIYDVLAAATPSSLGRLSALVLAVRLLAQLGGRGRAWTLVADQLIAEQETEALNALWSEPAAGEDR